MTDNIYAAAWTVIQNCCEAAVTADLLDDPLISHLANAAALCAAQRIGIPERELLRIRQLMADERRALAARGNGIDEQRAGLCRGADEQRAGLCRGAANSNEPWSDACARPADESLPGNAVSQGD